MLHTVAVASLIAASSWVVVPQPRVPACLAHGQALSAIRMQEGEAPAPAPKADPVMVAAASGPLAEDIWATSPSVKVQGKTLKTWPIGKAAIERVQLAVKSDGRPVNANIELWYTPSYIPTKFRVYSENGVTRPVTAVIETPQVPKTVAVYNTGEMEFPFDATVANTGLDAPLDSFADIPGERVQGGKIKPYAFGGEVSSVQVMIKTDERNLNAKIELTQGPNQVKQIIEVYATVGYKNPAYFIIQTPGADNTIRVINQNPVEFPFDAWVLPYETEDAGDASAPIMGGGGLL